MDVQLPVSGSQIWQILELENTTFASKAHAVACDSEGKIYVAGQTSVSPDDDGATRLTIRKYPQEGKDAEWTRHIPQNGDLPLGLSVARGIAIDSTGIIYVVGELDLEDDGGHLWIGKFSSDGLLIADYTDSLAFTRGRAIVIDPTDDNKIYIVGFTEKLNSESGFVAAFDSNLKASKWIEVVDDPTIANNRLFGVTMNSDQDLLISGAYRPGVKKVRALVLKYTAKGAQIWWRAAKSPPEVKDIAFDIDITKDGEIIGIGRQKGNGFEEALWTFRLDKDGDEFVSSVDTGALCGIDGCSVTIDASGNHVFAGASAKFKGASADTLLRKLSPGWLEQLWSKSLDGFDGSQDRSLAVAIDPDGFVYGVGFETKDMKPRWWVGKFNP